jgi:predicted GNAT family acetyltransferase
MPHIEIAKKESVGKFFIPLDSGDAHILYKMRSSDTIELVSTVVSPEFRGKPYAEELAVFAFDYVRKNHLKVIVTCPYLKSFIEKNKEKYKDLEIIK